MIGRLTDPTTTCVVGKLLVKNIAIESDKKFKLFYSTIFLKLSFFVLKIKGKKQD